MQNFEDTFETRKRSFISAFLICMTVPLKETIFGQNVLLFIIALTVPIMLRGSK